MVYSFPGWQQGQKKITECVRLSYLTTTKARKWNNLIWQNKLYFIFVFRLNGAGVAQSVARFVSRLATHCRVGSSPAGDTMTRYVWMVGSSVPVVVVSQGISQYLYNWKLPRFSSTTELSSEIIVPDSEELVEMQLRLFTITPVMRSVWDQGTPGHAPPPPPHTS